MFCEITDAPIGTTVDYVTAIDPDDDASLEYYFMEPITSITPDGTLVDRNVYDYTVSLFLMHYTG